MMKRFLPLVPALLLAGCTTGQFTRLTPGMEPRATNNLYPVEVAFDSHQQSLRWDSIHATILVNGQQIPMHQEVGVNARWEGYVPVPAGVSSVKYRVRFDYLYNHIGTAPKPAFQVSPEYTLTVTEP